MNSGDKIASALFEALTDGGSRSLIDLYDTVTEFARKYPRSYMGVRKQPFAAKLLDAIEEAYRYTEALSDRNPKSPNYKPISVR